MQKKTLFACLFFLLLCSGCLSPSGDLPAAPTLTADAPTPTPPSTPEATATPKTSTKTEVSTQKATATELGLNDPKKSQEYRTAFKGAEQGIVKEGNQYIVTAVSFDLEGKPVENKYTIDIKTFDDHAAIKNKYRPATVQATDADGNQVTLIWDSDHKAWHTPFNMVDNSKFDHVDEIPEVPQGYEKLAVQSALLYFQDHPPFDQNAVNQFQGISLLFEGDDVNGKSVVLKSKGNDDPKITRDSAPMKASELWIHQTIGGESRFMPLIVILDPDNPKKPQVNEFKIIFGDRGDDLASFGSMSKPEQQKIIDAYYKKGQGFVFPYIVLYGDKQFKEKNNGYFEQGNDFWNLDNPLTPGYKYKYWFDLAFEKTLPREVTLDLKDPNYNTSFLSSKIQGMDFFLILGSW